MRIKIKLYQEQHNCISGNVAPEDHNNELRRSGAINMLFISHDMNQIHVEADLTILLTTK